MASSHWLSAAAVAACAIGCGTKQPEPTFGAISVPDPGGQTRGGADGGTVTGGGDAGSGAAACTALGTSGTPVLELAVTGGDAVAIDALGDIYYATDSGIAKLDALTGKQVFAFPYGSVFALDAAGDAFVAGAFSSTLDFGGGVVLVPSGNVDVFVAKLSPSGQLDYAVALGLCGDGVESIAVARDGRIAVSGASMGTAVLDASAQLRFQLAYDGQLAFDSHGDLFVGGAFAGSLDLGGGHVLTTTGATDQDAFLAEVDATGAYVTAVQLGDAPLPVTIPDSEVTAPTAQTIAALAIDAHDEVALLGTFTGEMSLFGQTLTEYEDLPSGGVLGTFVATLDAAGHVGFAQAAGEQYSYNPTGAIAIADDGRVAVSSNLPREAFAPNGHPELSLFDATGAALPAFGLDDTHLGYGLGVAFDACDNVAWVETDHTAAGTPLQPTLRLIAR